jgi:hypothetical protein
VRPPPGAARRPLATYAPTPAAGYTLHQLRHSGLTHLAAKGRSAAELQAKSRHRHLANLDIYVRLGQEIRPHHRGERRAVSRDPHSRSEPTYPERGTIRRVSCANVVEAQVDRDRRIHRKTAPAPRGS